LPRTAGFELDAGRVLDVARRMLRDDGYASVTMRKLANALGVTPPALYYYFPNKDALLDAVIDDIFGEVSAPGPGPWQERMRQQMLGVRAAFGPYPWALPHMLSRVGVSPHGLALTEDVLGTMLEAGFTEAQVAMASMMLAIMVIGHAQLEGLHATPGQVRLDAPLMQDLDISTMPTVVRLMPEFTRPVGEPEFEYALDMLIATLEGQLAPRLAESRRRAARRRSRSKRSA
jgi:AcrR family transcriptional regulator